MRKYLFLAAVFAFCVWGSALKNEKTGGLFAEKKHTVVKNDTLWDLSSDYYGDPFKWGIIYNANIKSVKNPDLIYPEQKLVIPGVKEKIMPLKAEPEEKENEAEEPPEPASEPSGEEISESAETTAVKVREAAPKPAVAAVADKPTVRMESLRVKKKPRPDLPQFSEKMPPDQTEWNEMVPTQMVPENWKEDGVVLGKEGGFEDSLAFKGDVLKLKTRPSVKLAPGDLLGIYKKGNKIKVGKEQGVQIQRTGLCRIIETGGHSAGAYVVDANSPLMRGMVVKKE